MILLGLRISGSLWLRRVSVRFVFRLVERIEGVKVERHKCGCLLVLSMTRGPL